MFAKLNRRIARTLITAVIPTAMSFGLAGSSLGDIWTDPQPAPVRIGTSVLFAGSSNGNPVSFQMFYMNPKSVTGYLTINNAGYRFVATVDGNNIHGTIDENGKQTAFEAVLQGNQLVLKLDGREVTLQQVN